MTILGPLIMGGFISLAMWLSLNEHETQLALVIDQTKGAFVNKFESNDDVVFSYSTDSLQKSLKTFKESPFHLIVFIPRNIAYNNEIVIHHKKFPSFQVEKHISNEVEKALDIVKIKLFKINQNVFDRVKTKLKVKKDDFNSKTDDRYKYEMFAVGMGFSIVIFFFIFFYGVQVMRGVLEEKTNRIIEVIISSVKPFQLMMGKIIGNGLVGLTQFALWIILTSTILTIVPPLLSNDIQKLENASSKQLTTQLQQLDKDADTQVKVNYAWDLMKRVNWPLMISMFLFYFICGYLLYGSLYAAVGSAVDSEAESQQLSLIITAPLMFAYMIMSTAIQNPESAAITWLSIIPFTSPIVMLFRVAGGIKPEDLWQLYLSMSLLIGTFMGSTWLSGRIYRTGILMYGKKASFKELWKWIRYSS